MSKLGCLPLFVCAAVAQEPIAVLVQAPAPTEPSTATGFLVDGGRAFFAATTDVGTELFTTDGTPAGTHLVVDLATGPASSDAVPRAVLGTSVLVGLSSHWFCDPNGAVRPLPAIPRVDSVLGVVGNRLLYHHDAPGSGELWSLAANGSVEQLPAGGATLAFHAGQALLLSGTDVYTTDGTAAGTTLLIPGCGNATLSQGRLWLLGGLYQAYLSVFPIAPNATPTSIPIGFYPNATPMVPTPHGVVYVKRTGTHQLMTSDGTVAGTRAMNLPFTDVITAEPWRDRALVIANDGVHDFEPWITDGTEAGTYLLGDLAAGPSNPWRWATTPRGTWFVLSSTAEHSLVFTDGTPNGTVCVEADLGGDQELVAFGDAVLFTRRGVPCLARDATLSATPLLPPRAVRLEYPRRLGTLAAGGRFAMQGYYQNSYPELLVSDGTTAGTRSFGQSVVGDVYGMSGVAGLSDDLLLFPGPQMSGWVPLDWNALDLATGAVMPLPALQRPYPCSTADVRSFGDRAVVADGHLVISDGRSPAWVRDYPVPYAWTRRLLPTVERIFAQFDNAGLGLQAFDFATDQWRAIDVGGVELLHEHRGLVYYRNAADHLCCTDGSGHTDLGLPVTSSYIAPAVRFFVSRGSLFGWSNGLFTTDGTPAGTHWVTAPPGVDVLDAAGLDDAVYCVGRDAAHGAELWSTDGANWTRITDLIPGPRDSVFSVATCADRLFLAASDGSDGVEPYASDGTAAGTHRLADLMPGLGSSMPRFELVAGDHAYFSASTPGQRSVFAIPLGRLGAAQSERIGQGCVGRNGIPQLTTPRGPHLGDAAFRFDLADAAPFAPVVFALDLSTTLLQVGPCRLRCAGGLGTAVRTANGAGALAWGLPFPNAPIFLGLHLTAQAAVLDPFAAPGFAVSTALGCVVGGP